jgi:uncharacterized oligopeptide transporter (OPT) family protein
MVEEEIPSSTGKLLKKYSYVLLGISAVIFAFSILRIGYCGIVSEGVYADFCKLSGVAYFNFYAFPMLILGLIGLTLDRISESQKTKAFFVLVLAVSTIRFLYGLLESFLA